MLAACVANFSQYVWNTKLISDCVDVNVNTVA